MNHISQGLGGVCFPQKNYKHYFVVLCYVRASLNRLKFLCDGVEKGCGFAPQDESVPVLETVLLDLSSYDCDELVTSSLNLLTQMYFFEEELFGKAVKVSLKFKRMHFFITVKIVVT